MNRMYRKIPGVPGALLLEAAASDPPLPAPGVGEGPSSGGEGEGLLSGDDWEKTVRRLRLSVREGEVIRCLIAEQKDRVIAVQLGISTHTVRSHLERIFRKLSVHTRTGVVVAVLSEALKIVGESQATK